MLKARLQLARKDGPGKETVMVLGVSAENVRRLQQRDYVFFDARSLGFSGSIYIVYGETKEAIAQELGLAPKTADSEEH